MEDDVEYITHLTVAPSKHKMDRELIGGKDGEYFRFIEEETNARLSLVGGGMWPLQIRIGGSPAEDLTCCD